ncbi:hypothetical protein CSPX01_05108 [Colletotrichum filicis]|nr:hypothetical protein CSPX01_05108 [Colletotrichum filicis]
MSIFKEGIPKPRGEKSKPLSIFHLSPLIPFSTGPLTHQTCHPKGFLPRPNLQLRCLPPIKPSQSFARGVPSHVRTNGIEDKIDKHFPPKSKRHQLQLPTRFDKMTLARHLHFFDHKTTIIQVLL